MLGDVGYIAVYNFDETSAAKTIEAIERVRAQGARALLFDVRYNPGGLKSELLRVLDYLLPEGDLFRSEDYQGNVRVDVSVAACVDLPMAVLVNQDSYSAAEFFAAALSEYGAAKTVGTRTCGKGYFQTTKPLSDGSASTSRPTASAWPTPAASRRTRRSSCPRRTSLPWPPTASPRRTTSSCRQPSGF